MTRSTRWFDVTVLPVALWIAVLAAPTLAQQPVNNANDQGIFADYYANVRSLQQQHQQKLAEIDERYTTALRAYREENATRAQSMSDLNTADHKAVREKGLKGAERQAEYDRIQAADKKRRTEYAQWRDNTARQMQEEHAAARSAEIERHRVDINRLLADRNAKLVGIRSLNGTIGLTPGATAALGEEVPSDSGPTSTTGTGDASSDEGESDVEADLGGLEMLERANDGQAGIGTADGTSSGNAGDDPASPDNGLEVLGRADEMDSSSSSSDGTAEAEPGLRVSDAAARNLDAALQNQPLTGAATRDSSGTSGAGSSPETPVSDVPLPRSLPPRGSIGNEDLLGGQDQTLSVPPGVEPSQAGTRIAVAFPDTGGLVEVGDSGVSTKAFELSATTAVSNSIRSFNFRVLGADGTIVVQNDVCGVGAARSTECGNNPRFTDFVDLSDADPGSYRLAVQALDSAGDAVSRVVEFQVPYRAVIAADVEIADLVDEPGNGDCTWTVSGRVIDWNGNPVAGQALFVEARRDSKRRVREHREWTDWNGQKWGAATTDGRGHFSLTSQKLDHCGGEREFRVSSQVGAWNMNLGQALLTGEAAVIPDPLVLPRAESNTSFDILTYNTALIIGGGGQGTYRARTIGQRVHRYHVVVLNEAFRNRVRWNLINELKKTWRNAGHETTLVGDGRPLFDNGGVDVVTRLPVLEQHATEYSKARGFDRLADKGAVHARVRANNGQPIDIFASHLQAGGGNASIRAHQLGELRDFISRHSDPDVPFLVLGDMNLKTPEEQSNAIRILQGARSGVRDAWQWRGSGECVTKGDSGRCLDFIYVGNVSGERPLGLDRIAVRKFEDAASRSGYLSDHFGLEAGFTVTPGGMIPSR